MARAERYEARTGGSGFAWTVQAYDRQCAVSPRAALVYVCRLRNRREHELRGVPLQSEAEIELELLEEQLEQRGLRVRAADGDADAVARLVEEAARCELLIEEARETARVRAAAIQGLAMADGTREEGFRRGR